MTLEAPSLRHQGQDATGFLVQHGRVWCGNPRSSIDVGDVSASEMSEGGAVYFGKAIGFDANMSFAYFLQEDLMLATSVD